MNLQFKKFFLGFFVFVFLFLFWLFLFVFYVAERLVFRIINKTKVMLNLLHLKITPMMR